jgi:adenylate cyclase
MTALQRRRLRLLARICVYSALGGAAYGVSIVQLTEGTFTINSPLNGTIIGLATALLCSGLDLVVVPSRIGAPLRGLPFAVGVLAKGLWYGFAAALAQRFGSNLFGDEPAWAWSDPRYLLTVGLSFIAAQLVSFTLAISEHLGHGVLPSLVTGRYHRPREESRVFLFVDMVDSTAIAERIGPSQFLRLLDRFASDLVEPVLEHHGTIYRYVGD